MGGFDTTFFMYAEELDLCYRLRQSGRDLIMTPKAEITHLVGGGSALNPRRTTSIAKAKMHFLRKHRGNPYASAAGILFWLTACNRTLAGWLGRSDRSRLMKLADACAALAPAPLVGWIFGGINHVISVVIPAFNEAAVIGRTLRSVLTAIDREPGEVLVVCNGCHDETAKIAAGFGDRVRVFELEQGSKTAALNLGDEAQAISQGCTSMRTSNSPQTRCKPLPRC